MPECRVNSGNAPTSGDNPDSSARRTMADKSTSAKRTGRSLPTVGRPKVMMTMNMMSIDSETIRRKRERYALCTHEDRNGETGLTPS